ncbi:hypothetical protein BHE74_00001505 [Ensete ventricosum]|nr:hypothetical protein BHE74_00001505 [Ensete ventricosum]
MKGGDEIGCCRQVRSCDRRGTRKKTLYSQTPRKTAYTTAACHQLHSWLDSILSGVGARSHCFYVPPPRDVDLIYIKTGLRKTSIKELAASGNSKRITVEVTYMSSPVSYVARAERDDLLIRGSFRAGRTEWAGVSTRKGGVCRRRRRGR